MPAKKPPKRSRERKPAPPPPPAPAKSVGGRPPYEPTEKDRQTVRVMVAGGIEQAQICGVLKITRMTLRKYYRDELENGAAAINAIVVAEHLKRIRGGDFNAIRFWEQARMGWTERVQVNNQQLDKDGNPADQVITYRWADAPSEPEKPT
jgi:hypothetical protein